MPRRARIMLPGVPVHIIQRGNNRADIFFTEGDRQFYLFHLARLAPRARCRVHAYCLMTNHVHLLLTAERQEGCALVMKSIAQLYAQYVNKTYKRSGYLWESRFKSCLVQAEDYLLTCYRYIEFNPVRGGLVRHSDEYPWSSYGTNAMGEASALIEPHEEYLRLGKAPGERQAFYRELFATPLNAGQLDDIRTATNTGYPLGSAAFKRALAKAAGKRVEKGQAGRPPKAVSDKDQLDLF